MKITHSSELLSTPPKSVEYLIDGFIPIGGVADVSGPPGEGKSTILLSAAAAISAGESWIGLRVSQTPVAWVSGEASDENVLCRDLHRLGVSEEADISYILPDGELFRWDDSLNVWGTTPEGAAAIQACRDRQIGMVVLDTIGSLVSGMREIDNDQQRQLARHLRHAFTGMTCITISHTNQSSAKDQLSWRLHYLSRAGGNGFPGALRWAAGVSELHQGDDGYDDRRRLVAFGASKHNEMPSPVWTNRKPAIFEIRKDGGLVLVRDGRETKPDLHNVKARRKEVHDALPY